MVLSVLTFWFLHAVPVSAQLVVDDEHRIRWHDDSRVSGFRRPSGPAPVTVASGDPESEDRLMPLDEAIRAALQHSEVIRVLTGAQASSSGRTIYDTAIATTPIDAEKARFDPVFRANSAFSRQELPALDTATNSIFGTAQAGNDHSLELSDLNSLGGTSAVVGRNRWDSENAPDFLTKDRPSLEISYTQPLLAGLGTQVNRAPIVIARLQQEQSYFQFKNAMQGLVRDVISAYWLLVQARTELWTAEILVRQLQFSYDRAEGERKVGRKQIADAAQAQTTLANAKARLIAAQGNVLQREAALRNLMGLPPEDGTRLIPTTPPTRDRVEFRWEELVETAQGRRPDLIELNLILMADQQQLLRRRNLAQPSLDAQAIHRWNGLAGRTAGGTLVNTPFDNHTDWTLGVTFSVPLSLRKARADVRSTELLIAKDRANIQQLIHQLEHQLATVVRNIDLNLEQYEAFREARDAASRSIPAQRARARLAQLSTILNELVALTDWANAVSAEAQALAAYNSELANLEFQTGTILETHGIRFVEEQFASIGPHGQCFDDECYPRDLRPQPNSARYPDSGKPAEEAFELKDFPLTWERSEDPAARLPEPNTDPAP